MAAIGIVQLKRLETEFIPARRRLYELYRQKLSDIENVAFFVTDPDDFIVPHILPLRILEEKRQLVANDLQARGIPTGMHYKPNHLLSLFGGGANRLPNVEKLYGELLTVPLHPCLADEDVILVCDEIKKVLGARNA